MRANALGERKRPLSITGFLAVVESRNVAAAVFSVYKKTGFSDSRMTLNENARTKQKKQTNGNRAYLHGDERPQVGEVTRFGGATLLSI